MITRENYREGELASGSSGKLVCSNSSLGRMPSPGPAPGLAVSQSVCLSCEPHAPLPTLSQGLPWKQRPQYIVLSAQMYGIRTGFLT